MGKLTHFDNHGQAQMVDIGSKGKTHRIAVACGHIVMKRTTFTMITAGGSKKGDVLGVARIAAILGAKRTAELIPLAHPLALTRIGVEFVLSRTRSSVECVVTAETHGRTGVEMEALTGVTVGLLAIYDMCKAADRGMRIEGIGLLEKKGGKTGHWTRNSHA